MMPEEWPIAAFVAEGEPARAAGRGRLATVRRDFFLDPAKRLTEQERSLMTVMLNALVGDVADSVRAALPSGRAAANDEGDAALIALLRGSGLLDQAELMGLLLRRADEERIGGAARVRSGRREPRILQGLVSHHDGAVGAAAMALILGRGHRRDRFGQPLVAFDDLSPPSAQLLVHAVAAGLRRELAAARGAPGADLELADAATRVLSGHDQRRGIDALTAALVHCLDHAGAIDDALILAAANEGEIAFIGAVLAHLAQVPTSAAMDELMSGDAKSVIALFRVAGASRELVANLLAGIGDLLGIDDAGAAIDLFARMSNDQAQASRAWLMTAPDYRGALDRLGQGRG